MKTLAEPRRRRKKAAKQSPFGREIADLLSGRADPAVVLGSVVGAELADRWIQAARSPLWRSVAADGLERRGELLEADATPVPRFCAFLLMVLEQTRSESGRTCTRALYRGRTHTRPFLDGDGVWRREYVPAGHTGGLAARLGCSVKTVERMAKVAEHFGIVKSWQAPKSMGEEYRGHEWGYSVWQWLITIPRQVRQRLGAKKARQASQAPAGGPETVPPARPALSAEGEALAARLLREVGPLAWPPDPLSS